MICIRPSSSFWCVDWPHSVPGGSGACAPDESAQEQHGGGMAGGPPRPRHTALGHRLGDGRSDP